jgi:hypothetical protein
MLLGLDDAGAGDEEELAASYRNVADIEWIRHECYLNMEGGKAAADGILTLDGLSMRGLCFESISS